MSNNETTPFADSSPAKRTIPFLQRDYLGGSFCAL